MNEFKINQQAVRSYVNNLKLGQVKIIDGFLEEDSTYNTSYLLDLLRLETGETEESLEKERRLKTK
jgi:hypothetical protein